MILRRLSKNEKEEIVEAYCGGENTNSLAEKYNCSSNTINRIVKTLLPESEYKLLKKKRLKNSNKKVEPVNKIKIDGRQKDSEEKNYCDSFSQEINVKEQPLKTHDEFCNSDFEEIEFLPVAGLSLSDQRMEKNSGLDNTNDKFNEIVDPLTSSLENENKELDFNILNQESLPESVYMLVDKKVELEVKAIAELPEWSFLPKNELKRNAILLFSNQRSAKRNCSKNQRVIKIPNTSVFNISKPYLFSKGITRLILEDSIIALDN
tara:strand:- start:2585 stop:3376 length:792 start_codon:yes stop_codon:yes gene_type:complete